MSKPHPWSREAQVEAAKTDVDAAYQMLAQYLNVHFYGTPTLGHLRELLRSAYSKRAGLQQAIECAEVHFPEINK